MKRNLWAPILAIAAAILILVPTTFAVGADGEVHYARLTQNRFPGGIAAVDAQLRFLGQRNIRLDVQILGGVGRQFAIRVYVDGNCANPGGTGGTWVINRETNAGPNGPFLLRPGNSTSQIQVNQLDVDRVRAELQRRPNQTFALLIATVVNGVNYRTCTAFSLTPPGPITFTSTTATTTATGSFTTRTSTITTVIGTQTFTVTFTTTAPVTTGTTTATTTTTNLTTLLSTVTSLSTGTSFLVTTSGLTTGTATLTSTVISTGTNTTVTIGTTTVTTITTGFTTITTGTTTFTTGTTFSTGTTITL